MPDRRPDRVPDRLAPRPLRGPPLPLPHWLDRLAETWARRLPRTRATIVLVTAVAVVVAPSARLAAERAAWGESALVLQATRDVAAGEDPRGALRRTRLPLAALPADPVADRPGRGVVLALPLVEGAVLTAAHLAAGGPAAGITPDQRLVPVPVDGSWGVEAGALVDVWAVGADGGDPDLITGSRPVLAVDEDRGRSVALVAVHVDDVAATTAGLSRGGVLLTLRGTG